MDGATEKRRVVYVDGEPHIVIVDRLLPNDIIEQLAGIRQGAIFSQDGVTRTGGEWSVWMGGAPGEEDEPVTGLGVDVVDGMRFYVTPRFIGPGAKESEHVR